MSKKSVTIEFFNQEGDQEYNGRCIGLLTNVEFSAITNDSNLQRRLMTVKTISLTDIAQVEKIENLRLAVVIKITSKERKGLFITEPIEMISQFVRPNDLTLIGKEGSYITVTEKTRGAEYE